MKISKNDLIQYILIFFSIYLIYIPSFGNANVSIGLILLSCTGLLGAINYRKWVNDRSVLYFIAFTLSLIIPLLYSIDINQGINCLYKNVISVLLIIAGIALYNKDCKRTFLNRVILFGIPLAILNVLFVFFNEFEMWFYNSSLGSILVAPSGLTDLSSGNVRDIYKAGTIFINANNASVFFCVFLIISTVYYLEKREKKYLLLSSLYLLAELATGCRTGVLAILIMGGYVIFRANKKYFARIVISVVGILILALIIYNIHIPFIDNILIRLTRNSFAADPRLIIWEKAIENINILGTGFGGWELVADLLPLGLRGMPPHNHILILMYWGGIIPVLVYLLFWFSLIKRGAVAWKGKGLNHGLILLLISINVLIHGFFDNYFLHNPSLFVLLFLTLGYLIGELY